MYSASEGACAAVACISAIDTQGRQAAALTFTDPRGTLRGHVQQVVCVTVASEGKAQDAGGCPELGACDALQCIVQVCGGLEPG